MPTNDCGWQIGDDADASLMVRVRDQDCQQSFAELVRRWRTRIEGYCRRVGGNVADAEDLAQEIFQKLHHARNRYQPTGNFSAYVWRLAANHCRDFLRAKQRKPNWSGSHDQVVAEASAARDELDQDTCECIQQAIWRLPVHFREVVVLRHYEDLPFADIAQLLEIPRGTVASRMAKALRLLEAEFVRMELIPDTQTVSRSHSDRE
jgi:RNA polymerase sigma-70 factor (ECF subfamily)